MSIFHRVALADDLAARLLAAPSTSASGSGLFLAAPRRTGKSTFLREDLRPALERRGATVIYADLWADRVVPPQLRRLRPRCATAVADRDRVAVLEAPHATRGADVDEVDALVRGVCGVLGCVSETYAKG